MPEATRILLVRHGQSRGNAERRFGGHSPTPLSELGVAQANSWGRIVAFDLARRAPAAIFDVGEDRLFDLCVLDDRRVLVAQLLGPVRTRPVRNVIRRFGR